MRRILLVEPPYKNKYPPLGLMKIAAYHKSKGDDVYFVKDVNIGYALLKRELSYTPIVNKWLENNSIIARNFITNSKRISFNKMLREYTKEDGARIIEKLQDVRERYRQNKFPIYDRVYVTTLFTFYWKQTIKTIKKAQNFCAKGNIYVGGIAASLVPDKIFAETGIQPMVGLLDKGGELDAGDRTIIDHLPPDYTILGDTEYKYPGAEKTYFAYTTRGCVRHCPFCAVPKLEPEYQKYIDVTENFKAAEARYGQFKHIVLLDNNVLASPKLTQIVADLKSIGCGKDGSKTVDFNQGLDARLLTDEKTEIISGLNIKPVRIAFDHWEDREIYEAAVRRAAKYGVKESANYLLYNFEDTPEELYHRLRLNVELSEELHVHITSFPMKYHPLDDPTYFSNRNYIGKHWNKKFIRTIQNLLIVTKGVVGPGKKYFEYAFGNDAEEFMEILWTPEVFLRYRKSLIIQHNEWKEKFRSLNCEELSIAKKYIASNDICLLSGVRVSNKINDVLAYYYKWGDGKKGLPAVLV